MEASGELFSKQHISLTGSGAKHARVETKGCDDAGLDKESPLRKYVKDIFFVGTKCSRCPHLSPLTTSVRQSYFLWGPKVDAVRMSVLHKHLCANVIFCGDQKLMLCECLSCTHICAPKLFSVGTKS